MLNAQLTSFLKQKYITITLLLAGCAILFLPIYFTLFSPQQNILDVGDFENEYPIAEVIRQVRNELYDAQAAWNREGESAMFQVEYFDLEIAFVLRQSTSVNSNVDFELLAVGSDAKVDAEHIQRIKLHLKTLPSKDIIEESTELDELEVDDSLIIDFPSKKRTPKTSTENNDGPK